MREIFFLKKIVESKNDIKNKKFPAKKNSSFADKKLTDFLKNK